MHGDDHTNRTAEDAVKDAIKSVGETVIISCSMGARSFSVPNIVAVINCKDGGSVGAAVQQASRCFTLKTRLLVWLSTTPLILSEPVLLRLT